VSAADASANYGGVGLVKDPMADWRKRKYQEHHNCKDSFKSGKSPLTLPQTEADCCVKLFHSRRYICWIWSCRSRQNYIGPFSKVWQLQSKNTPPNSSETEMIILPHCTHLMQVKYWIPVRFLPIETSSEFWVLLCHRGGIELVDQQYIKILN
jgi:hypothetical protein